MNPAILLFKLFTRKPVSFGSITDSRFFLSIEPAHYGVKYFSTRPPYVGCRRGLQWNNGRRVVMFHVRNKSSTTGADGEIRSDESVTNLKARLATYPDRQP